MTLQTLALLAVFAIVMALRPAQAAAQLPQHYSHKQLRLLIASAANANQCQKLATYFHYRQMMFRTKAQKALDQYALDDGRLPMATKFITRAEAMTRLHDHYSVKANENAKLARRYDQMLTELGVRPATESATIVSVKMLQGGSSPEKRRPATH